MAWNARPLQCTPWERPQEMHQNGQRPDAAGSRLLKPISRLWAPGGNLAHGHMRGAGRSHDSAREGGPPVSILDSRTGVKVNVTSTKPYPSRVRVTRLPNSTRPRDDPSPTEIRQRGLVHLIEPIAEPNRVIVAHELRFLKTQDGGDIMPGPQRAMGIIGVAVHRCSSSCFAEAFAREYGHQWTT